MAVIKFVAIVRESAFRRGLVKIVGEDDDGVEWFRASNILLKEGEGVYLADESGVCQAFYFSTEGGADIVMSMFPPKSLLRKLEDRNFVWMFEYDAEESEGEEESDTVDITGETEEESDTGDTAKEDGEEVTSDEAYVLDTTEESG